MNFQSQIPLEKLEKLYFEFIRIQTGNALVNSQYVEYLLKILCDLLIPNSSELDEHDLLSRSTSKKTLGVLKNALKNANQFNEDFLSKLEQYIIKRNRFIHGLYFHTFQTNASALEFESPQSQEYLEFCSNLIEEGSYIIETGMGIYALLIRMSNKYPPEFEEILNNFNDYLVDARNALEL